MTGGSAPKRKGSAFERKTKAELEDAGYLVVRSADSRGVLDLLAVKKDVMTDPYNNYSFTVTIITVLAVQCKLSGRLSPVEREELIRVSEEAGALPVLASRDGLFALSGNGREEFIV